MNGPILRRMLLAAMAGGAAMLMARRLGASQGMAAPPRPSERPDMESVKARLLAALPYERITVEGTQALAEWTRLKSAGRGWPVIVGDDEALTAIADQFSIDDPSILGGPAPSTPPPTPAETLQIAAGLQMPQDLSRWSGVMAEDDLRRVPEGTWPDNHSRPDNDSGPDDLSGSDAEPGLTVATDVLTGKPYAQVHILLIPARSGWEVPAYLRYGNWNGCPPAEYHVAALREWHARFGAELVGLSGDTMNLRVARPPEDRTAAMALARDQYRYCPDLVEQGAESLSALAAGLMHEKWWFFWWD